MNMQFKPETCHLRWTAFRVMSQREKSAVEALKRRGYSLFYPVEIKKVKISRHAKRKEPREFPIIPGYLFLGTIGEPPLFELSRFRSIILGVVKFGERVAELDPEGMQHLINISGRVLQDEPTERGFNCGDKVKITAGPCQGLQGIVAMERAKKARQIIELLGSGRHIDVPLAALELA